ncbi:NAC domain-containing protein 2-like [Solanum dulcamara]|uniref:NAC domain-containing protein 2-like n=1 Tax=Solanum dulcamara TaxID=45834 RepID=UPI00248550D9|nr:NAC domain-containing protein 2-like [Solanum dulcamara]
MSREKEEGIHGEEWKVQIPPGFRFCPTDVEILQHYLLSHVTGQFILPGIIREVDVYESNPYHLPGIDTNGEYTYFFTERGRKYVNGSKTARVTRDKKGHWKSTSKLTQVFAQDPSNLYLGKKNTLVYYVKAPGDQNDIKTNWIMHEFVIANNLVSPSTSSALPQNDHYNDVVACRIYEKPESNKNRQETQEIKTLINSLIGPNPNPNPVTTNDSNGEAQPSIEREIEPNTETLIFPCDHPHYTANYLCDSQELQAAAILGNMITNYEIGQSSNTTISSSPHDDIVVPGGSSDQASTTVYQNPSDQASVKTQENSPDLGELISGGDLWDILNMPPPDESFSAYMKLLGDS